VTHAVPSRLRPALAFTALVAIVELAGALASHSLALLSDAAHVGMDVVALAIAVAAEIQAARPASGRQTYGFARVEVLAALANGGILFAITAFIAVEAVRRLSSPVLPAGGLMLGVATFGAVVNVGVGAMLAKRAHDNLNVRAALFHVAGDALAAVAVMVGAAVILVWGIAWIDPLLSLFVAATIVVGIVRIVKEAAHVLLESAPLHAPIDEVRSAIRSVDGVVDVHDLHVWTIGGGSHVLSAHVLLNDARISEATAILRSIEKEMRSRFEVAHVTVQFECESCAVDERIVCTQVDAPLLGRVRRA
jgi:cobalt-zinc-cadmium efflux system protein